MDKRPAPAKVTRPLPAASFPRPRLYKELDRAWRRPLVWISGSPGSGKTTLTVDYLVRRRIFNLWYQLDAEDDFATFFHYLDLSARHALPRFRRSLPRLAVERTERLEYFARDFFSALFERLKPPFALVFDNYQDLPSKSPLHEVFRHAAERLPRGGHLVIISRHEPPAEFARARLNEFMAVIDDSSLRFTRDETRGMIRSRTGSRQSPPDFDNLHTFTHGWAAGLTLMLEQSTAQPTSGKPGLKAPGVLFDYFASEVFEKLDTDIQAVLLRSALLPTMTAPLIRELSGERRAGRILNHLSRNHFFTTKLDREEPAYQFHPLFREFLLSRLRRQPASETRAVQLRAAALLVSHQAAETALTLYRDAEAWPEYTRCLQSVAAMLASQGRHHALAHWLSILPREQLEASSWMQYWTALCGLPHDPLDSLRRFESAMAEFRQQRDGLGSRLAWCGGVNAIQYAARNYGDLARWIDAFADLPPDPSGHSSAGVMASMLTALVFSDPCRPGAAHWIDLAQSAVRSAKDYSDSRVVAGTWLLVLELFRGNHVRADELARRLEEMGRAATISASNRILSRVALALHAWLRANTTRAFELVNEARNIADETGVRLWDSHLAVHAAATSLTAGALDSAGDWLDQVERNLNQARGLDLSFYHYLVLWRALLRGEPAKALEHTHFIGQMGFTNGLWFADALQQQVQAIAWLQAANPDRAQPYIQAVRDLAARFNSHYFQCLADMLDAHRAVEQREWTEADAALSQGLATARQYDIVHFPGWLPNTMARLCARALESGIETTFVRDLVLRRGLPATDDARDLEQWPWPIRIYTFGRFSIVRNDQPIATSGRAPSRPLELLAALLAEGGRAVPETRLCEMLWPEADGDAAHRAFDTTLHRLRKLLVHERALLVSDGKLSLNPVVCWVDTWSFERQVGRLELVLKSSEQLDRPALDDAASRLNRYYRGAFMGRDAQTGWALAQRERLHAKYLRVLNLLAGRLEAEGNWAGAVDIYEKALEIQPTSDDYIQKLTVAYRQIGRAADASTLEQRRSSKPPKPGDAGTSRLTAQRR